MTAIRRDEASLAECVAARLCHDLGSPLGALLNGVDLIEEISLADAAEEFALLARSARRAAAMLAFLRLSLGRPRDWEACLSREELRRQAEASLGGRRVVFAWSGTSGAPLRLPFARLLALELLVARAALGLGGSIHVAFPESGSLPLSVVAEGERAGLSASQRAWLTGATTPMPEPREVEFLLLPLAAAAVSARIETAEAPGRIALRAVAADDTP